jgi:hypothetical protein
MALAGYFRLDAKLHGRSGKIGVNLPPGIGTLFA